MHIICKWTQKAYGIDEALRYLNHPPGEHCNTGLPHPGNSPWCRPNVAGPGGRQRAAPRPTAGPTPWRASREEDPPPPASFPQEKANSQNPFSLTALLNKRPFL